MKIPTIYLAACDNYLNALKATQYLFGQFWPDAKVVVLGYKQPEFELKDNWSFVSMGKDPGQDKWSNGLIEYFNSIDDTHFIFNVEDCPPIKPVRVDVLKKLLPYMDNPNIAKITLTEDLINRQHYFYDSVEGLEIIKTSDSADYRLSTQYAIWRKDYFLKYLRPNMNAWQFEIDGSKRAMNDGYDIIGTNGHPERDYVIHSSEAVRKGNYDQPLKFFNLSCKSYNMELDDFYIKDMQNKGII